jgi:hypothetical protein
MQDPDAPHALNRNSLVDDGLIAPHQFSAIQLCLGKEQAVLTTCAREFGGKAVSPFDHAAPEHHVAGAGLPPWDWCAGQESLAVIDSGCHQPRRRRHIEKWQNRAEYGVCLCAVHAAQQFDEPVCLDEFIVIDEGHHLPACAAEAAVAGMADPGSGL